MRERRLDAILLGGDIGEADSVTGFLAEIETELQMPIYFVLGNHDFYRGSIAGVRNAAASQAAASQWLRSFMCDRPLACLNGPSAREIP